MDSFIGCKSSPDLKKIACSKNDNDIITDLCNSIENVLKIVATF